MKQSSLKVFTCFQLVLLFVLNPLLAVMGQTKHSITSTNTGVKTANSIFENNATAITNLNSELVSDKSSKHTGKESKPVTRDTGKPNNKLAAKVINISAQPLSPPRESGQSATLLPNGQWLLIGGKINGNVSDSLTIEDSAGGLIADLPIKLQKARAWHTSTMLPDGRILIFGGVDNDGQLISAVEVFDWTTRTLSVLNYSNITPRSDHTATLLTNGTLLMIGGTSASGEVLDSIELWDFETGETKSSAARLHNPRRRQSAALLPSGDVIIWGGIDGRDVELLDSERFDLESQRFISLGITATQEDPSLPYLVASIPREGDVGISIDSRIALRFSKALKAESLNTVNIILTDPEGIHVSTKVIPAESGMLAFITPDKPLHENTNYNVVISNVADVSTLTIPPTKISFATEGKQTSEGNHHSHAPTNYSHDQMQMQEHSLRSGRSNPEEWVPDKSNLRNWRNDKPLKEEQSLLPLLAEKGVTALSGRALTLDGEPLSNVTLQIGELQTRSDETGRFLLKDVPKGHQVLVINGSTSSTSDKPYAMFDHGVEITEGITTVMPFNIWLPIVDTRNVTQLPELTAEPIVAKTNRIPGLEVQIPGGARLRYPQGKILRNLTITPIPINRTPFPLPPGAKDGILFTLQLHSAKVEAANGKSLPGLRVIYPNYLGLPAGERVALWNYAPRGQGWYIYGYGTVSLNEKQVVPDVGTELQSMHCFTYMGNPGSAPVNGPPPGTDASDGDPVDLNTGLFVYSKTDLILPDTIPIVLTRTYRQADPRTRAFGVGTTFPFSMFLEGNSYQGSGGYIEIILPTGGRIRYEPAPVGWFPHTATPSMFHGSTISINTLLNTYDVKLLNGSILRFLRIATTIPGSAITDLQAIIDSSGNELKIDGNKITSPNGRWVELTVDGDRRITKAKDNTGRIITYTYDASGRLWKVADAANNVTEYSYDGYGLMRTIKDARGVTYLNNEYDTYGRVFRQTQADGSTYGFVHTRDANNVVTQTDVTDERGNTRRTTYNQAGYTLTETFAFGKPEQQIYTIERIAGSNLPSKITDALGRKTTFTYNSNGKPTSVTALAETAEAVTENLTYDAVTNQLSSVTNPLNHTTSFAYDPKGNLTSLTDALNHQTTFAYNGKGQLISAADALNNRVQFGYDGSDLTTVTDPLNRTVSRFIDTAGRPTQTRNMLGQVALTSFNATNQVTKSKDALGGEVSLSYDGNGNLLGLTDQRLGATNFTYDNMDRVKTRRDALQGATSSSSADYDLAGNVIKTTDRRGKATTLKYDALNRNTFIGFGTTGTDASPSYESTIQYTFDKANRLTQVADSSSGTIIYEYDNLDRLKKETTPQGAVSYTYDAANRQKTMTVSGQPTVNYNYDNANRLTSIVKGSETVSFGYDNADRQTSLSLPNGVATNYEYDAASQLTGITYKKGGATLGNLTYGYDQAGRRINMGGSLAQVSVPSTLSGTITYNAANQLKQRGAATLTYDANGNLTNDGVTTYTWNARNQLTGMSRTGLTASFTYDVFGRRISKNVNGVVTKFLYNGNNAVQEQNASGTATANMLTGGVDQVFSRTENSVTSTFMTDGLGSTIGLLDSAGATKTSYMYEPFGNTIQTGAGNSNSSKYTGREDDGTGLYYYRARYYSPSLQRFISEDPVGFAGGINLYAYVGNDPINYTDPSGTTPLHLLALAVLEAAGTAYDVYDLGSTLFDKCADWTDVGIGAGGLLMGTVLPGAGYGKGLKGLRKLPIWTSTKKLSSPENALKHWNKHRSDFPDLNNSKEYVEATKDFLNNPPSGALKKVRADGDTVIYDPATNIFGIGNGGVPRTMFKPNPAQHPYSTNLDYFNAQ